VTVDLSLLAYKALRYEKIVEYIKEYQSKANTNGSNALQSYHLVDIFEDEKLLPGKKSVTVRFEFGLMDRTLEGQEISAMVEELLAVFGQKGIELRK
jgi:phenylalanyl-tRNA synthetase beta chain